MENELINLKSIEDLVLIRGRITNQSCIKISEEYRPLIDKNNITVSITPIGSQQNIIIKGITGYEIHLQSNGGLPIDCFYHIFAKKNLVDSEES